MTWIVAFNLSPFALSLSKGSGIRKNPSTSSGRTELTNKLLKSIARAMVMLATTICLHGCYLMQAAQGQLAISSKREPIADVIADPDTPADLQRRLKLIAEAREFASRELALPDNESYRSY